MSWMKITTTEMCAPVLWAREKLVSQKEKMGTWSNPHPQTHTHMHTPTHTQHHPPTHAPPHT